MLVVTGMLGGIVSCTQALASKNDYPLTTKGGHLGKFLQDPPLPIPYQR
jgi:hypothetical protein